MEKIYCGSAKTIQNSVRRINQSIIQQRRHQQDRKAHEG
jgi:hypothetical protein